MYFAKIFLIGFLLFFLKDSTICETSFEYYYSRANYHSESNLDSCIYYSKKAFSFAKTYEDSLKALNSQIGAEYLNQEFKEIEITLKAIEKTLRGSKEICFLEEVYAYNNLGVIYSLQGRFEDSFKWHIKLLAVIENFSIDNLFRLNIYLNIGKVLFKIGDFDSAITILELSLKFSNQNKYLEQKNEALILLATIYLEKKDFKTADIIQKKIDPKTKRNYFNSQLIQSKIKISETLIDTLILRKMAEDDPWLLAKFYEFLGDYYSTQKPLLARNSYQKALKELNQYYFHTKISYFQIQLALKLIKCNVDQSFYQDAENLIRNLYSKIGLNTKYINQDVSFNQYNQLTLNLLKLNLLLNRKTKKENITSNSNLITSSAIILRNIFYSYPFDDSKYSYFERNNSHFEDLIRYSIYESEVTSPNKKLEDCILLFELNKAQKLVSDVEKNQKLYSDTFRYKEFLEITNEIRAVKEIINVKEGSGIECNLEKSRLLALEVIRRDLFFMSGREKKLFNLNVNSKYNLQKLKDYFNDHRDETLIELYEGVNDVYIFSLSYKKDTCFIVHKSDLEFHTIKDLYSRIIDFNLSKSKGEYSGIKNLIFKKIINPCLSNNSDKIIYIPDNYFSSIPLELLLVSDNDSESHLIKFYAVSYQYSIELWQNLMYSKSNNNFKYDLVAFAPKFDDSFVSSNRNCIDKKLGALNCNVVEINNIKRTIKNSLHLIGNSASIIAFKENAGKAKILHLSTHSCLNLEDPSLTRIYFSNDFLTKYELSLFKFPTELTILSACNTGHGAFKNGEGIMSLAKGFFQAGSRSLLTAQWSIDDCVTPIIIEKYYRHLKNGERKDRALQLAKIEFLEENPGIKSHPYFWAGLVQFGDCSPIEFTKSPLEKSIPYALAIIPIGLGLWYRQRRKKAA